NGDGKADLAVAQYEGDKVTTFLGNGGGTFASGVDYPTGAGSQPRGLIARSASGQPLDLNEDGKADLAVGYEGNGFVGVLLGDGMPDLITGLDFSPGFLEVALNNTPVLTAFGLTAPSSVTIGVPFDVTVTAKTSGGVVFTNYAGTAHFTSSDGSALLPPDTTF